MITPQVYAKALKLEMAAICDRKEDCCVIEHLCKLSDYPVGGKMLGSLRLSGTNTITGARPSR